MKKRIAKKKRNREIKDLAQKQRQKGNVTHVVWDSIEGINFSTMIYSNNKKEALNFMNKDIELKIDHMFLINTEEIKKEMMINDYCISGR